MEIVERGKSLWTTGTVAVAVAAVGDFFSSVHGYLLPITAAAIALLIAVYFFLQKSSAHGSTESRWSRHGVHVFLVFSVVTAAIGAKSSVLSQQGGILGTTVPAVSNLQDSMGLLQKSIQIQGETRDALKELSEKVKKETSNNPRKELANRGIEWTDHAMRQAMNKRDLETVNLFLDGGYDLHDARATMGNMGMHYFTGGNFEKYKPLLNLLNKRGYDFIGDYADLIKTARDDGTTEEIARYQAPLMAIVQSGKMAEAQWLISHGDPSRLTSYGKVLASSLYCGSTSEQVAVARFFIKAGTPIDAAREKFNSGSSEHDPTCQPVWHELTR